MPYQHPFDVIKLSEIFFRNNVNLLQYVQILGYKFCYENRDERRGWAVRLYIKDTTKYKKQRDFSIVDETIEHMRIECQGKNKNKN